MACCQTESEPVYRTSARPAELRPLSPPQLPNDARVRPAALGGSLQLTDALLGAGRLGRRHPGAVIEIGIHRVPGGPRRDHELGISRRSVLVEVEALDFAGLGTACVRQEHDFPIIILSARSEEQHQVRPLDSGANDYVTKPFREGELMARVRAALRRPMPVLERREIRVGSLHIESTQRRVFVRGVEVTLTRTEFELLDVLARSADRVLTHRQLLRAVWGDEHVEEVQYLRVYIKLLRSKIEKDPARPTRIVTKLGVGYRLITREAD